MKRKKTSETKKTGASKPKRRTGRKKTASKRKKPGLRKTSSASKAKMKKTIMTLKNGLKELEKEVNR